MLIMKPLRPDSILVRRAYGDAIVSKWLYLLTCIGECVVLGELYTKKNRRLMAIRSFRWEYNKKMRREPWHPMVASMRAQIETVELHLEFFRKNSVEHVALTIDDYLFEDAVLLGEDYERFASSFDELMMRAKLVELRLAKFYPPE